MLKRDRGHPHFAEIPKKIYEAKLTLFISHLVVSTGVTFIPQIAQKAISNPKVWCLIHIISNQNAKLLHSHTSRLQNLCRQLWRLSWGSWEGSQFSFCSLNPASPDWHTNVAVYGGDRDSCSLSKHFTNCSSENKSDTTSMPKNLCEDR